jgi:hypothetical protein
VIEVIVLCRYYVQFPTEVSLIHVGCRELHLFPSSSDEFPSHLELFLYDHQVYRHDEDSYQKCESSLTHMQYLDIKTRHNLLIKLDKVETETSI